MMWWNAKSAIKCFLKLILQYMWADVSSVPHYLKLGPIYGRIVGSSYSVLYDLTINIHRKMKLRTEVSGICCVR